MLVNKFYLVKAKFCSWKILFQKSSAALLSLKSSWGKIAGSGFKNTIWKKINKTKPCKNVRCKYVFACIYLFMQGLWRCFGELWGRLHECWAKEFEFPAHFYSVSLCSTQCQKRNSIGELQQCSLIEVSQKVSMEGHTGNVFVSIDSGELKYFLACTSEVMLLSKWFLEAKRWFACDLETIWEVSAAGDKPESLITMYVLTLLTLLFVPKVIYPASQAKLILMKLYFFKCF